MANKTNVEIGGKKYYRIRRTVDYETLSNGHKKPIIKAFYGRNRQEAEQKYKDYIERLNNPTSETFEQVFTFWLTTYFDKSQLKPTTKQRYSDAFFNVMAQHPIVYKKLTDIGSGDLQTLYNNSTCAPSTVHSLHKILSLFYTWAVASGTCSINPTSTLVLPKVPKRKPDIDGIEVWTTDELHRIMINSQGHRLHFMFIVLANTGLRISECLALKYSDIDINNKMLKVQRQLQIMPIVTDGKVTGHETKTTALKTATANRSIPLQDDVITAFEKHKNIMAKEATEKGYTTDYIFTTARGTSYDTSTLRKTVKRLYAKWNVTQRGFHCYRHTYASRLATSGVPIQIVSSLLGHSDIGVTAKYYLHIENQEKRNAIENVKPIL